MRIHVLAVALLLLPASATAQHPLREVTGPLGPPPTANGSFGVVTAWLGDLDQDGFDDFGAGAPDSSEGAPSGGSVFAYSGRTGALLWEIHSSVPGAQMGFSIQSLGLIDADPVPDVLIGTRSDEYSIRSGSDGSVIITNTLFSGPRCKVAAAGDMDGDGIPEYLVSYESATGAPPVSLFAGIVFVVSGATHSALRTHTGILGDPIGDVVISIGDVDQDNRDDYAISHWCPFNFGCPGGSDVFSGATGALLYHVNTGSSLGFRNLIRPAGDFNGDGTDDIYFFTSFSDIYSGQSGVTSNDIYSGSTGIALGVFGASSPVRFLDPIGDLNSDQRPEFLNLNGPDLEILDAATLAVLETIPAFGTFPAFTLFANEMNSSRGGGDANSDGTPDFIRSLIVPSSGEPGIVQVFSGHLPGASDEYCFGDGGDMLGCTPCPCGNESPETAHTGCINVTGNGARLLIQGFVRITDDLARFEVRGASPSSFALLLSSPTLLPQTGPCPPGSGIIGTLLDGVRCIGGSQIRHGVRSSDLSGDIGLTTTAWGAPHGPPGGVLAQANMSAGQTRNFQAFYRDDVSRGCGTGINTTNGVSVTALP